MQCFRTRLVSKRKRTISSSHLQVIPPPTEPPPVPPLPAPVVTRMTSLPLLQQIQPTDYQANDDDSESAYSDDAIPSSSLVFNQFIPTFDLEQRFPAILHPIHLIHTMSQTHEDVDALRAVSQIFLQCFNTIVFSMDQLPSYVRMSSTFEVAHHGVVFARDLFKSHMQSLMSPLSDVEQIDAFQMSIQLLDMSMSSLKSMFLIAERELAENKPLPALPFDDTEPYDDLDTTEEFPSTENADEASLGVDLSICTASLTGDEAEAGNTIEGKRISRTKNIIQRLMKRPSLLSLTKKTPSLRSKGSTLTLVNPDLLQCLPEESEESPTSTKESSHESPVKADEPEASGIRASLAIFPDSLVFGGRQPWHIDFISDVHVDVFKRVISARLPILVTILTGLEFVADSEFKDTFFLCFRYFMTPRDLYERLVARYDEQCPEGLAEMQASTWQQEASQVKFRVAMAICTWLDLYWRHETDKEVYDDLFSFTKRISQDSSIAGKLVEKMIDAFYACSNQVDGRRGNRLQRRTELVSKSLLMKEYRPTKFKLPTSNRTDFVLNILHFKNASGCDEIARSLTAMASDLWRTFEPEDAVMYWHDHENKEIVLRITECISFEKAISLWVSKNILDRTTPSERATVMACFLEIATECVRMRNFGCAYAIFSGCTHYTVERMQQTRAELLRSQKKQYKALEARFNLFDNCSIYRSELESSFLPAVPLMFLLIRDIETCFHEVPATIESPPDSGNMMVNFKRYRTIAKRLRELDLCHIPYKLKHNENIENWITSEISVFIAADQKESQKIIDEFYSRSRLLEPRRDAPVTLQDMITTWIDSYATVRRKIKAPSVKKAKQLLTPEEEKAETERVFLLYTTSLPPAP